MIAIYETTCRICLNEDATYPIFESNEEFESVYNKLPVCLREKIEDIDGYPRYICLNCKNTSESISNFVAKFEETCEVLKGIILQVKNEPQDDFTVNLTNYEPEPFAYELLLDNKPLIKPKIEKRNAAEILESLSHLNVKIVKNNSSDSQDTICSENDLKRKRGRPVRGGSNIIKNATTDNLAKTKTVSNCAEQKPGSKQSKSADKPTKKIVGNSALRKKAKPNGDKNSKAKPVAANNRGSKQCADSSKPWKKRNEKIESEYCEYSTSSPNRYVLTTPYFRPINLDEKSEIKENLNTSIILCDHCGTTFSDKRQLKNHINKNHVTKEFKCTSCPKEFINKGDLNRHQLRHDNSRPFVCDTCGKAFYERKVLNMHNNCVHKKIRKKVRIYKCQYCDKMYTHKRGIVVHERSVHTGERPDVCNICGGAFYDIVYLREHMRLHTGDMPFKCPVCARGYAQRGNMKSHMRNHKISELDPDTKAKIKPSYFKFMRQ